ncbi:MAG: hypothetical protein FJ217_01030 [Ignavibacteria bacterium]|nr:hypothetical protein [Ignavibacteria bacterium]
MNEPREFFLPRGVNLAYRPVMHKLIGSRYSEPPDEFWSRLYEKLAVPQSNIFPMVTPVDQETIRAYFNAGILVVHPERGLLRRWPPCFEVLCCDSVLKEMSVRDRRKQIFLHQAALTGAILTHLDRSEMMELPEVYNYPLFLHQQMPARLRPVSLDSLVTLRYDILFADPSWGEELRDSSQILQWFKQRFPAKR